jgi:hypothetical protein
MATTSTKKPLRDPRADPLPGDIISLGSGAQYVVAGLVISLAKSGREMPCVQIERRGTSGGKSERGVLALPIFKQRVARGVVTHRAPGPNFDWAKAPKKPHSELV